MHRDTEPIAVTFALATMTQTYVDPDRARVEASELITSLRAGRSSLVVVEGGLGTGKSAILGHIVRVAAEHPEITVLRAWGSREESGDELGVVCQLVAHRAVDDPEQAQHGFAQIHRQLAASQPLVIVVDDLHHCDEMSLRFLGYLARRLHSTPILLAVTLAAGEQVELMHGPAVTHWRLCPLPMESVVALCHQALGSTDPALAQACVELTGGNPMLLTELLSDAAREPDLRRCAPAAIATQILSRVDSALHVVLHRLSLLSTPVNLEQAARLTGLPLAETADAVAALRRLALIDARGEIQIVPEIVRRAIRHSLSPSQQHDIRLRVATALSREDTTIEAAALHLAATYPAGDARHVDILRRGAAAARARGDDRMAADLLRRALREPPASLELPTVLSELAAAELHHDQPAAVEHLRALLAVHRGPRSGHALTLAYAHTLAAQLDDAAAVLESALDGEPGDARLPESLAALAVHRGRIAPDGPLRQALAGDSHIAVLPDIHLALSGQSAPTGDACLAWHLAVAVLIWADDTRLAGELLSRPFPAGSLDEMFGTWQLGLLDIHCGRPTEAAERLGRMTGWPLLRFHLAGELALPAGDLADDGSWLATLALAGRGRQRIHAGLVPQGLADVLTAGERLSAMGCHNPAISGWRSAAAHAYQIMDRLTAARPLADEEVSRARAWGAPRTLAAALRRRAVLATAQIGLSDTDEALALLDGTDFPLERAATLLTHGRLVRRSRRDALARTPLTQAYDLAIRHGAAGLADQIRGELLAAGGRPRVARHTDRLGLTGGEERVAELAIKGLTNDDIARELYLARRTVEAHLTSIYRKLGILGRSQLAGAMRGIPALLRGSS